MARHHDLPTDAGTMPCIEALPPSDTKGAAVVVHEAYGLTSHIESICDRLAAAGWRTIAPALFHRQDSPVFSYDDYQGAKPVLAKLTAEGLAADIDAALDRLAEAGHSPGGSGIVGFCMGGAVAFHSAVRRPLGAAVTFYGGGVAHGRFGLPPAVDVASRLQAPWLGLYGDRDKSISVEEVEALRASAAEAPVPTTVVRHPQAGHGFNCDDRSSYDPSSAADAWARTVAFLDHHLS